MTTDSTIENESADYQLGYDAGYEAGKEALKKEIESGERTASELYGKESYSFLSDKEVRNLLAYVESMAVMSEAANAHKTAGQRIAETNEEIANAFAADADNVLKSIIGSCTNYQGVTPTAVTDFLTNNNEV